MRPAAGTLVCALGDIPEGGGRMFAWGEGPEAFRLLVLGSGETCLGYENRCPHFGMPFAAREEQLILKSGVSFSCNVHYARFRWADGYCEAGDCFGESVPPVALAVVDGQILLA